jgi:hypothetical protein
MDEHAIHASGPRPVAATIIGALACVWGVVIAAVGLHVVLTAEDDRDQIVVGALELGFAAVALALAVGAFRVKRWAWVALMSWAAVVLAANLLRAFFFPSDPSYSTLAIATVTVMLLTPVDVQVAFGVRRPHIVRLDAPTRNPIDGA